MTSELSSSNWRFWESSGLVPRRVPDLPYLSGPPFSEFGRVVPQRKGSKSVDVDSGPKYLRRSMAIVAPRCSDSYAVATPLSFVPKRLVLVLMQFLIYSVLLVH